MKGPKRTVISALVCVTLLAAVVVFSHGPGAGAAIGARVTGEATTPFLTTDDRWSYFGGEDDARSFVKAISGPGTRGRSGGEAAKYVWGRWESCLECGAGGIEGFSRPRTMVMEVRDGKLVRAVVCCGDTTIELRPVGEAAVPTAWE